MRTRLDSENCSIARSLDVLCDPWSFLVLREAFLGVRRFSEFQAELGVSKNVLSARLRRLVEEEILELVEAGQYGSRQEYALTAKGKDLAVVLTALRQWGDRWIFGEGREPMLVYDTRTDRPVPQLRIQDEDGRPLPGTHMRLAPGPGATPAQRERFSRKS